jgi:hypothetical protein
VVPAPEEGAEELSPGLNGARLRLVKACREKSRRDVAIVAWHEVPGVAPGQKVPSRRVRSDPRSDPYAQHLRNAQILADFGFREAMADLESCHCHD